MRKLLTKQELEIKRFGPWVQHPEYTSAKKAKPFRLLSGIKRAAFILHMSNFTHVEIAGLLSISERTVRYYIKESCVIYPHIKKS